MRAQDTLRLEFFYQSHSTWNMFFGVLYIQIKKPTKIHPWQIRFLAQIKNGRHRKRRQIQMSLISQQNNLEPHVRCHFQLNGGCPFIW